jgi:glycosyltransferase involved in cell wall biosynthesis/FMN phosphatase YigB (HAD superfamily)
MMQLYLNKVKNSHIDPNRRAHFENIAISEKTLSELLDNHFDSVYYAKKNEIPIQESRKHYLNEGIKSGSPINEQLEFRTTLSQGFLKASQTDRSNQQHYRIFAASGKSKPVDLSELTFLISEFETVTFDFWGTLVFRRRHAELVKYATARRMWWALLGSQKHNGFNTDDIYKKRLQIESRLVREKPSHEYLLFEVIELLYRELFNIEASPEFIYEVIQSEIHDEIKWTTPNTDIVNLFELSQNRNAVVSDFYMSKDQLKQIVDAHIMHVDPDRIFVSSSENASKWNHGELFTAIRKGLNIIPEQHLHIGDNHMSDVVNALEAKCSAAVEVIDLENAHTASMPIEETQIAEAKRLVNEVIANALFIDTFEAGGVYSAIIPVGLVIRAIEEARKKGSSKVFYLSREGEFLSRIHAAIADQLNCDLTPVNLEVSRQAIFGLALDFSSLNKLNEGLNRLFSSYQVPNVKTLLTSIGLEELYKPEFDVLDERFKTASLSGILESLFDEEFLAQARSIQTRGKTAIEKYLSDLGLFQEKVVVVCDVGWRGTVQDCLSEIFDVQTHGVYLGLFPFLNEQLIKTSKLGVAFDGNIGDEYSFAEPPAALERLWTRSSKRVHSYTTENSNLGYEIVYVRENNVHPGIEQHQNGVLSVANELANIILGTGLSGNSLNNVISIFVRYHYSYPHTKNAELWFDSEHDDSFGAGGNSIFGKSTPDLSWLNKTLIESINEKGRRSGWYSGYVQWKPVKKLIELSEYDRDCAENNRFNRSNPYLHDYFSKFEMKENLSANRFDRKILFLVGSLDISGGSNVIMRHANECASRGYQVYIAALNHEEGNHKWIGIDPKFKIISLSEAGTVFFEVVVATWWPTTYELPRISFKHCCYFVQSIESRFDVGVRDQRLAELTYSFGIPTITIASWISNYLYINHNQGSLICRNGLDKQTFNPSGEAYEKANGVFRVVIEGSSDSPMKGIETAINCARNSMADEIWVVGPLKSEIEDHRLNYVGRVNQKEMAKILRSCDVLVKTSMVEGMFGPPLEMMACGGTVIAYDVTGHSEYVRHEVNGLIIAAGKKERVTQAINELKSDAVKLQMLKLGAIRTANDWPSFNQSSQEFVRAIELICSKNSVNVDQISKNIIGSNWILDNKPRVESF